MSAMERIRHEVREVGLVTTYFLLCFGFFLTLKKLILLEYEVRITVLGTAALAAVVVAKVVIVLGNTSFGNRFRSYSLALHVAWRTVAYTAMVFVVTLAERAFEVYRQRGHLEGVLSQVWTGEGVGHFVAMNMTVGVSLLAYNVYSEIDAQLGEGTLRKMFFSRRGRENGRVEGDST